MAGMTPFHERLREGVLFGWDCSGGIAQLSGSRVTHHKGNCNNCLRPLVENASKVFPRELRLISALVSSLGHWRFPKTVPNKIWEKNELFRMCSCCWLLQRGEKSTSHRTGLESQFPR